MHWKNWVKLLFWCKIFIFHINALLTFLFMKESWTKCFTLSTKIWISTAVFNIIGKQVFLEQHIRMFSGGSCDTEDWSNANANSALHHIYTNDIFYFYNKLSSGTIDWIKLESWLHWLTYLPTLIWGMYCGIVVDLERVTEEFGSF